MKNDLTCAVARDLLPSYVEGLTSEETNGAVEAHLAACPECAALAEAAAESGAPAAPGGGAGGGLPEKGEAPGG